MRLLYVGVGLKEVVCLLCGYVWGIGKYLSRKKREGFMRYTGGENLIRTQRRVKDETMLYLLLEFVPQSSKKSEGVMRYTGGESLIRSQRRIKDETMLYLLFAL